ncbi:hypothetical protein VP1G_10725 [Cytospora mali]|uniref:Uncharacterized protein n=1 Tax=Cytospora mali TaxID=578113 RepID=A0A194UU73_CYTMA|nr:hypothetical protein VP1G_10725 [Valsa mali var. pyri (nom. inval.)]
MPSDRRQRRSVNNTHGDDSSDDGHSRRKSRPRGYNSRLQRGTSENSLIKTEKKDDEKDDSQWDTDYDPRDKYYLSAEDDPFDLSFSRRDVPSRNERSSRDRESSGKHHSPHHGSPSRNGHKSSHSHGHTHRQAHPHSHSRDKKDDSIDRHKSTSHAKPDSAVARPRPRPSRASSSRLNTIRRPRATRAGSSHITPRTRARPGPARGLSHHGRQTKPKSEHAGSKPWDRLQDINWEDAAKVALQAGTVAACKVGSEPIPWTAKGTKIASAALGAAVVDHVLQPKKRNGVKYTALRYLTEFAVGSMVVGPALGKVEQRRKR